MKLQVIDNNDKIVQIEIDDEEKVETFMQLIEIELGIPAFQLDIMFAGKKLLPNQIISQTGLKDGDMIEAAEKAFLQNQFQPQNQQFLNMSQGLQNNQQPQQQQQGQQNLQQMFRNILDNLNKNPQQGTNGFGNQNPMHNPMLVNQAKQIKQQYMNNPNDLNYLFHSNRALAEAIVSENLEDLVKILNEKHKKQIEEKMQRQKRFNELQKNPFDPENQKEIERMIQEENIERQRNEALEEHPEFFGSIKMLYINAKINGTSIQAFVDSGAQSTIISAQLAEKCGILRLLDKRFAGMAIGVGQSKILGRIHVAQMEIGDKNIPVNLTVLENSSIGFLLGLDTLKRYQCVMDLGQNSLTFILGSEKHSVKFLGDGEILKDSKISSSQMELDDNEVQPKQEIKIDEDKVKSLVELGATREKAIEALKKAEGNLQYAANYINQ